MIDTRKSTGIMFRNCSIGYVDENRNTVITRKDIRPSAWAQWRVLGWSIGPFDFLWR